MASLPCPTCGASVPFGDADHGDLLACPACGGTVTVRRPRQVTRSFTIEAPPRGRFAIRTLGVLGGVLLMVFGVCGLGGYVVLDHITDPEFTSYQDAEGQFSIEFPCRQPVKVNPMAWTANGPVSFPAVMCERSVPDEAYMIAWMDLPKEQLAMGPDAILDDACQGASTYNPMVATEVSRTSFRCGPWPGQELVCAVKGSQGKGILRAVLVGKRLYLIFTGGGFIQPDSVRARRFLDSFKPF